MPVRSMTGYAQLTHQVNDQTSFSLSLKSVNHRFLDLHFRMPVEAASLELRMRRILKEKIARGHIEVALSLQHGEASGFQLNHARNQRMRSIRRINRPGHVRVSPIGSRLAKVSVR